MTIHHQPQPPAQATNIVPFQSLDQLCEAEDARDDQACRQSFAAELGLTQSDPTWDAIERARQQREESLAVRARYALLRRFSQAYNPTNVHPFQCRAELAQDADALADREARLVAGQRLGLRQSDPSWATIRAADAADQQCDVERRRRLNRENPMALLRETVAFVDPALHALCGLTNVLPRPGDSLAVRASKLGIHIVTDTEATSPGADAEPRQWLAPVLPFPHR